MSEGVSVSSLSFDKVKDNVGVTPWTEDSATYVFLILLVELARTSIYVHKLLLEFLKRLVR